MEPLFNILQLVIDIAVLVVAARSREAPRVGAAIASAGSCGLLLASQLSTGLFHWFRLVAFLIFAHGPPLLLLAAHSLRGSAARVAWVYRALAVLISVIAVDAFLLEPRWLEVTRVELETDRLTRPLRIAVVADLQTDRVGRYEREVFEQVMRTEPDLILLPGDYLAVPWSDYRNQERELQRLLAEVALDAPLGVYATRGNTERDIWPRIFARTNVTPLVGTGTHRIGPLQLTGLSLTDSFDPGLRVGPSDRYHIVFGHAPDFALGQIDADLLIAGHTHGGQVRIPLWGPIITFSRVPRAWASGTTRLGSASTLVVSRGVGMERGRAPRMRLFCRPELVIIDIVPGS